MLKVVTGNLSYQLLDLLQNFLKDISEWRDADLSHHRIMLMLESPWQATGVLGDARSRVSFFSADGCERGAQKGESTDENLGEVMGS